MSLSGVNTFLLVRVIRLRGGASQLAGRLFGETKRSFREKFTPLADLCKRNYHGSK